MEELVRFFPSKAFLLMPLVLLAKLTIQGPHIKCFRKQCSVTSSLKYLFHQVWAKEGPTFLQPLGHQAEFPREKSWAEPPPL